MKLSKEELYRLHLFFFPSWTKNFFPLFSLQRKRIFFFFFRSCARRKGKKFCLAFCPLTLPFSDPPSRSPLPSLRSASIDRLGMRSSVEARVGVELFCCCCQMRLTWTAGPYSVCAGQFLCSQGEVGEHPPGRSEDVYDVKAPGEKFQELRRNV